MTGAGGEPPPPSTTISPAMTESDLPQPLITRTPSVSLKWPSPGNPVKNTPSRQVWRAFKDYLLVQMYSCYRLVLTMEIQTWREPCQEWKKTAS